MGGFVEHAHSFGLLDFPKIRQRAADYCLSEEGREVFGLSLPLDDASILSRIQAELAVIGSGLAAGDFPLSEFPDIKTAARRLSVEGAVLELADLFALGIWAKGFDTLAGALRALPFPPSGSLKAPAPDLVYPEVFAAYDSERFAAEWAAEPASVLLDEVPKLHDIYRIIFSVIGPDGELKDLPELRKIKYSITRANKDLLSIADSYRNDPDLKSALQSGEPTLRDGRTVLAVRSSFKGRVKGIIHEVSATGQTVFIEPAALVDKNNELVQLSARLAAETARILRETSEALRKYRYAIIEARRALALLDPRLARAIQCRREDLVLAETCDSGFSIWRGRHPLLGKKAVPIDVVLPDTTRTLIVTGPNTGGKTVTLKTIGLFALMHQLGLGLPAAQGTKFQIFDAVLADIGDEQSIDQSLSTFSGHMRVIADIAAKAGPRSLVLLDELGAGTDPEEGCAIAMGLLDHFIETGSLAIATTHHGILKNYGYTKPGCLNACMEFDSTKLAPTYRIVMGIPGESRALEIVAQMGLDQRIVTQARLYLDEERSNVGELIRSLSEKHRELESLERERRARLKEATEDQRKVDLASLRVKQKEAELRKRGVSELDQLLSESRRTLGNLVRSLRESGMTAEGTREVKSFISGLDAAVENQRSEAERLNAELEALVPVESGELLIEGREALYGSRAVRARLLRKTDGERWIIEVGSMRLTVKSGELRALRQVPAPKLSVDVELAARLEASQAKAAFELDLRGFRLTEALAAVERQIDAASLSGLNLFSIIHGTGEGVLGPGIHGYLKTHPVVADFHFARPEEGGYGKTVVRLKV
ncbi:MAG: Smr/MutS family protein [Spirochaetes bacterium]|nr:Smr/MutS family protein [Spirochaetota bacterium]